MRLKFRPQKAQSRLKLDPQNVTQESPALENYFIFSYNCRYIIPKLLGQFRSFILLFGTFQSALAFKFTASVAMNN